MIEILGESKLPSCVQSSMESLKHKLESELSDRVIFGEEELQNFRGIRSVNGDAWLRK
jgi:hypothetical protein